jgi:hypothetical protein
MHAYHQADPRSDVLAASPEGDHGCSRTGDAELDATMMPNCRMAPGSLSAEPT